MGYIHRCVLKKDGKALLCSLPVLLAVLISAFILTPGEALSTDWSPLIARLKADRFNEATIQAFFARPEVKYDPEAMSKKIESMIKRRYAKPSACVKCREIYRSFLRPDVIAEARTYARANSAVLDDVASKYCVPKEIIVSILLVETRLGKNLGDKGAFNTLASMALSSDLEMIRPHMKPNILTSRNEDFARNRCRQKADWAYVELKSLIRYADRNGVDPLRIPGSIYGAIGICQFMPSNTYLFGIDADGDGRIDLFTSPDALYSIGNYLKKHGWPCRASRSGQYRAIYAYNHSRTYAETILAVADKIKGRDRLAQARDK